MFQMTQMIQLIIFALLMSTGQFLFKKTAISLSALSSPYSGSYNIFDTIFRLMQVPWFYIAIFLYAFATLFWLYILQRIPLSIAYPFTATTMIWVPLMANLFFEEKLTYSYWMGAILIISGIAIIGSEY